MPNTTTGNPIKQSKEDTIKFEDVYSKENVVKAVSYHDGVKHEVLFFALPEDQFEKLIPERELVGEK